MTDRYINARGLQFFTREEGPAGAPTVVLLHGLMSTSAWWDLVAQRISAQFRVIRLDFRGHGRSEKPVDGYTVSEFARDVSSVFAELRINPAFVVGHSFGATVALAATRNVPVLCVDGGVFDPTLFFGGTWDEAARGLLRPRRRRLTEKALRVWTQGSKLAERSSPDEVYAAVLANFSPDVDGILRYRLSPENEEQLARSYWKTDWLELLATGDRPVGAILARTGRVEDESREKSLSRAGEILGQRLSAQWVEGGHDLPVERPEEISAAIFSFFEECVSIGTADENLIDVAPSLG
ncbi:MAG: alpha/beta hydrolase [Corynebacteriales bacterium]|nr:alpha/beta hydrolase [Mycobacteriales bacterium]